MSTFQENAKNWDRTMRAAIMEANIARGRDRHVVLVIAQRDGEPMISFWGPYDHDEGSRVGKRLHGEGYTARVVPCELTPIHPDGVLEGIKTELERAADRMRLLGRQDFGATNAKILDEVGDSIGVAARLAKMLGAEV